MKKTLLIVDDNPMNFEILEMTLKELYRVHYADCGEKALELAERILPDLILLDIMMPGMDGYDVCRRLKKNERCSSIPIIFVTAMNEINEEAKGLSLGAADYITKPFNGTILQSRIKTQLSLSDARAKLCRYSEDLEHQVKIRTAELTGALHQLEKMNMERQEYLAVIAHELRTPVNGILGGLQVLRGHVESWPGEEKLMYLLNRSTNRLIETIDSSLMLAKFEGGSENVDLKELSFTNLVSKALEGAQESADESEISLELKTSQDSLIKGDSELLLMALTTLLRASFKLAKSGSVVEIIEVPKDTQYFGVKFIIGGEELSSAELDAFWDIYSYMRLSSYMEELGFSLPLAGKLIESMGGLVGISNSDTGVEIEVTLLRS